MRRRCDVGYPSVDSRRLESWTFGGMERASLSIDAVFPVFWRILVQYDSQGSGAVDQWRKEQGVATQIPS